MHYVITGVCAEGGMVSPNPVPFFQTSHKRLAVHCGLDFKLPNPGTRVGATKTVMADGSIMAGSQRPKDWAYEVDIDVYNDYLYNEATNERRNGVEFIITELNPKYTGQFGIRFTEVTNQTQAQ